MRSQTGLTWKYGATSPNSSRLRKKRIFNWNHRSFKIDSWKDKNTGEDRYKPVVRVDRLNC